MDAFADPAFVYNATFACKGSSKAHPAVPVWSICSMKAPCAGGQRREREGIWVARARSLSEFQTSFPDETSCAAFLFERRWPQGFVCPACGGGRAALLKSRAHTYECLDCGRQTSITAGTRSTGPSCR
jgi:predicted RNA-binding Zn-ribbon protein involved in translation (DUF1610 family)